MPTIVIPAFGSENISTAAQNGLCTIFSEIVQGYSFDSSARNDFIEANTITQAGVIGAPYFAIRNLGLGSKAFIINGTIYFLSSHDSPFQPTFFLINGSLTRATAPNIVAKLAYENGGGYLRLGLPNVSISGSFASIPYLYKDDVEALNTLNNTQQTTAGGIYSQTGVNLATFEIGTDLINSAEIANNLHITGGYLRPV